MSEIHLLTHVFKRRRSNTNLRNCVPVAVWIQRVAVAAETRVLERRVRNNQVNRLEAAREEINGDGLAERGAHSRMLDADCAVLERCDEARALVHQQALDPRVLGPHDQH